MLLFDEEVIAVWCLMGECGKLGWYVVHVYCLNTVDSSRGPVSLNVFIIDLQATVITDSIVPNHLLHL